MRITFAFELETATWGRHSDFVVWAARCGRYFGTGSYLAASNGGCHCRPSRLQGEFHGQTTYGGDFVPMGVPVPAKLVMRSNNMEKTGPFEGESNYKANFV